jgi:hypothetical protein
VGDKPAVKRNEKPISWSRLPFATAPLLASDDINVQKSRVSRSLYVHVLMPLTLSFSISSLKSGTKTDLQPNRRMTLYDWTPISFCISCICSLFYHYIACCSHTFRLQTMHINCHCPAILHLLGHLMSCPCFLFLFVTCRKTFRSHNSPILK